MTKELENINIVIPMAGDGTRFKNAGFDLPKPFIDVNGKTMIENVIDNLNIPSASYILIARRQDVENNSDIIKELQKEYNIKWIYVDRLTEGAACTVLLAKEFINNKSPLLLANSDQIVDLSISDFISDAVERKLDGSILTFKDNNIKWSYAAIDENNIVTETKEKQVISEYATVGIYYFSHGKIFTNAAEEMIANNDRFNNEFYVCPSYNYAIQKGHKIGIYNIEYSQMHGIGTPEDLEIYLNK